MKYSDLGVHDRINLKGTYEAFLKIAVQRFKDEQEKKIYKTRLRKVGKKKTSARTRSLYQSFKTSYTAGITGSDTLKIDFLMYGRFVDMGVGRGTSINYALVRKRYGARRTGLTRRPKRWYPKRKRHQELRLQEIIASRYGTGLVSLVESQLEKTFTINM